jgi:hypothetical protein
VWRHLAAEMIPNRPDEASSEGFIRRIPALDSGKRTTDLDCVHAHDDSKCACAPCGSDAEVVLCIAKRTGIRICFGARTRRVWIWYSPDRKMQLCPDHEPGSGALLDAGPACLSVHSSAFTARRRAAFHLHSPSPEHAGHTRACRSLCAVPIRTRNPQPAYAAERSSG